MKKLLLFTFFFSYLISFSKTIVRYPADVEAVLKKAGTNRVELEKAISYCKKTGDPLKLKAVYFLIANMDIHFADDYYWEDANHKKVPFNELDYPDFTHSIAAFEHLKNLHPGLHPVPVTYQDIDVIKADFLINDIESAFAVWKSSQAKNIPFKDFCEYILPYRVSIEPLQNWRAPYKAKFGWINTTAQAKTLAQTLSFVAYDERSWFVDTWGGLGRDEPLPRLGSMQLLHRKNGRCEDIADLEVFTLRSQGIPAALNIIPYWATSTDSHFLNTVFDAQMQPIKYDVARTPAVNNDLFREPSKVIRMTYSKQPDVLADFENEKNIPPGFLRTFNYIDVTDQYWETAKITCPLFQQKVNPKIAYFSVFNGLKWCPTWWSMVKDKKATFNVMSKGVVYLPCYYQNGKIVPAGYPVAEGYHHEMVLQPDLKDRRSIKLAEENRYLIYQPGRKYKLFYWNNDWLPCGEQMAMPDMKTMVFNDVPKNALLLLLSNNSMNKERPFMVTDDGERVWW